MNKSLLVLALALSVTACHNEPVGPEPEIEFVCYDDGKMTERHVMVDYAVPEGIFWKIYYKGEVGENGRYTYTPRPGETCATEVYTVTPD